MYGNYHAQRIRESRLEAEHRKLRATYAATFIRENGGRLTEEQLRVKFTAQEISDAVDLFRTIHPESRETRQGIATYYVAN